MSFCIEAAGHCGKGLVISVTQRKGILLPNVTESDDGGGWFNNGNFSVTYY